MDISKYVNNKKRPDDDSRKERIPTPPDSGEKPPPLPDRKGYGGHKTAPIDRPQDRIPTPPDAGEKPDDHLKPRDPRGDNPAFFTRKPLTGTEKRLPRVMMDTEKPPDGIVTRESVQRRKIMRVLNDFSKDDR